MATTLPDMAVFLVVLQLLLQGRTTAATWCVARGDAGADLLQMALDYACGAGADCLPIQESGPCLLPDTVLAHASYAFNSYYMRSAMGAGSCHFSGAATIAKTDPSYGSCVYPASPSAAGEMEGSITFSNGASPSLQNGTLLGDNVGAATPTNMVDGNPPASSGAFTLLRSLFMSMMCMVILFVFQPMDVVSMMDLV